MYPSLLGCRKGNGYQPRLALVLVLMQRRPEVTTTVSIDFLAVTEDLFIGTTW